VMSPKATGARNATLVFSHSEGTTNAPLTGVAIGGDLEVVDPSDSYYRCDAGGARGLGLVGLVVAGLVARRRRKRT
jgi:hypothetical protein